MLHCPVNSVAAVKKFARSLTIASLKSISSFLRLFNILGLFSGFCSFTVKWISFRLSSPGFLGLESVGWVFHSFWKVLSSSFKYCFCPHTLCLPSTAVIKYILDILTQFSLFFELAFLSFQFYVLLSFILSHSHKEFSFSAVLSQALSNLLSSTVTEFSFMVSVFKISRHSISFSFKYILSYFLYFPMIDLFSSLSLLF